MTVKKLRKKLKKIPSDVEVKISILDSAGVLLKDDITEVNYIAAFDNNVFLVGE